MKTKSNSTKFKKGQSPWNKGKRVYLDLEKINRQHWDNEKSIRDISKELKIDDRLISKRLKEAGYRIRKNTKLTEEHKNKIKNTLIERGIKPLQRYSGEIWNKGLKGVQTAWNKNKVGLQQSTKKGKSFEEFYGEERTKGIKQKIKEARKYQVMPVKDTKIEIKIQNFLKQLGLEFLTHQYIKEIEHGYQCDIMIPVQEGIDKKTIIECFGTYWHNYPNARKVDIDRCIELRKAGWRILVFWENEIKVMKLENLSEVILR